MITRSLTLRLSGLVAVHGARAAHTALGGVPGIQSATVSMAGAEVEFAGDYDANAVAADIRAALEPTGVQLEEVVERHGRRLPLA